jgi:hypothetical protein
VCEIIILILHPLVFDVVDDELDIWRDPNRLDRRQINPYYFGAREGFTN